MSDDLFGSAELQTYKDYLFLRDRLDELLDDGTGNLSAPLVDLYWHLLAMPVPRRGRVWMENNPHVREYLRGLARGDISLTHAALHELPSWRTAAHLRDLLMAAEILPAVDRRIMLYESWHLRRLRQIDDTEHHQLLRQFANWHQLPRLHAQARTKPLTPGARHYAAAQFDAAAGFLAWLAARGRRPASTTQTDLDAWYAVHRPERAHKLGGFLRWATKNRHLPKLLVRTSPRVHRPPISQRHRLSLLRRALTDDSIPQRTRVAAVLLLLYAQPVARLARLSLFDITVTEHSVLLRLGDPPTPVPEPFATLLLDYVEHRTNMSTATNPDSYWLFPGQRAGEPLTPGALLLGLRKLGAPTTQARTAAFRQLVLQAPAPVVAKALGYGNHTAAGYVAAAGGTWSRYPGTRIRH